MGMKGWGNYIPPTSRDGANLKPAKRSKYGAVKTTVDGITFDSAREAKRWVALQMLVKAGHIRDLRRQTVWSLWAHTDKGPEVVGDYVADFAYENSAGEIVVEDVKGVKTAMYRWKKKHFEAQYGLTILET